MRRPFVLPLCEALECRQMLSAPDLQVTILDSIGHEVMVPGDTGTVKFRILNAGDAPAVGTVDITVRGSTDTTFDLSDPLLAGLADKKINLAPGRSITMTIKGILPDTATPDDYHMLVHISPSPAINDSNAANNTDATVGTSQVVWQFGNVDVRKNVRMTLHDGANKVVFALSGLGTGTVTAGSGGFATDYVTVVGSTAASGLKITTPKGVFTTMDNISVLDDAGAGTGSIKAIAAGGVNLESGVSVDGLISTLTVHDIHTFVHYILLNNANVTVSPKNTVSISAHTINGCSVMTNGLPIKKFTAAQITDLDLTAPWIGTFTVASKSAGEGNLSGTLTLDDENTCLAKLTVSGSMDNTTLDAGGTVKAISAGEWNTGHLGAIEVKKLTVKGNMGASVGATDVFSAVIGGDLSGDWGTGWIGKVSVAGDMTDTVLTLGPQTPQGAGLAGNQLESLTVKGWISSSVINCFNPIGSITAGGIENSNLMLGISTTTLPTDSGNFESHHAGKFKSIAIKGMKDDTGQYVDSFINTNIAAWRIDSISFGYVNTDNSGTAFGIAANSIGKMTYRHFDGPTITSGPMNTTADSWTDGDFAINILEA